MNRKSLSLIPLVGAVIAGMMILMPALAGSFDRPGSIDLGLPTEEDEYSLPDDEGSDDPVCDYGDGIDDCDGKVVSMKLLYTGEGCEASTNPQSGAASCSGGADFFEPVDVLVTSGNGSKIFADVQNVYVGDVVEVLAANAGESELTSNTWISIDNGLECLDIHTSCSKVLAVGDKFGSMQVVEMVTTNGGTIILAEDDCSLAKAVVDPDASTMTLFGAFCDDPVVSAGTSAGEFVELTILDVGEDYILVDFNAPDDLETCKVLVDCLCDTCHIDVTIADAIEGPAGPPGPQGDKGDQGPAGTQGEQGETGPPGPKGDQGTQGVPGPVGSPGPQGEQGPAGPQGDQGLQGETGPTGSQGEQGLQGEPGPTGPKGDPGEGGGEPGPTGPQGDPGPAGPQGEPGQQGAPGEPGQQGAPGPTGPRGDQGLQGEPGLQGDPGENGAQGDPGPAGPQGVPGQQGVQGEQGLPGLQGATGPTGPAGQGGGQVCPVDDTTRIGMWCVDNFLRPVQNFAEATLTCHNAGRTICPVEALMACDLIEPQIPLGGCTNATDDGQTRLWTNTYDASFEDSVFQSIVLYGQDNKTFQANAGEFHSYFCCQAAGVQD